MTTEELLALKAKILDAETSYHNLLTGKVARVVQDQNGERVEFTAINASALLAYIGSLNALLPCDPLIARVSRRPIGFFF